MFRIGGAVEEEENGKKYIRSSEWYEYVDPFEYLKDYGIIAYMNIKRHLKRIIIIMTLNQNDGKIKKEKI